MPAPSYAPDPATSLMRFPTFASVLDLIRANRDAHLTILVETYLRLAQYSPGRIEFTPAEGAPSDLAQNLSRKLQAWTGSRWAVTIVNGAISQTIAEERDAEEAKLKAASESHPLVRAVLDAFPEAKVTSVTSRAHIEAAAAEDALPEVGEEWDPFEEEL